MPPAPHPIETDEDRRARTLFVLKSLSERAHALALKVADKAEAQLDAPDPAPGELAPRAPDYHQTFLRYLGAVRLLLSAEHRIATGADPARRTYRPAGDASAPHRHGPDSDPRRPKLRQFIHDITRNSPDRAPLRRDANRSLDEALDRDTARTTPAALILHEICETYGLPFDLAKLPDEFLEIPTTGPP